ncbi:MerR family DNA-binding transcriptional regulator [Oxobacter pfennigii]|nr:MerR family DNA-binding transcriptional regulator [Oxobacter pfennigii]
MFSKLGKTTIKTLRYYDEVGLLTPAYVNEENGYHYYATDQLFKKYRFPLKSKD